MIGKAIMTARPRLAFRSALVVIAALGVALPANLAAKSKRPTQVVPAKKKKRAWPAPGEDTSRGGSRRGNLEITLGSLTAGLVVALIGRGAWELVQAKELEEGCRDGTSDDPACGFWTNPGRPGRIAAGLSFGVAVPVAVASGFLFARGIRIRRDYRTWRAKQATGLAVRPWIGGDGAGLALGGRF